MNVFNKTMRAALAGILMAGISGQALAADESKKKFGRDHLFVAVEPMMGVLVDHAIAQIDSKMLETAPQVKLFEDAKAGNRFCRGTSPQFPDMIVMPRRLSAEEYKACQERGVGTVVELKLGYEAWVLAASDKGPDLSLSPRDVFHAVSRDIPKAGSTSGRLIPNPNNSWKDINDKLTSDSIRVLGPAKDSQANRSMQETVLYTGCNTWDWIKEMKFVQKRYALYRTLCRDQRRDGKYLWADAGQTDMAARLRKDTKAVGFMPLLDWNKDNKGLKAVAVNDLPPTMGTVSKDLYPLSRTWYAYVKVKALTDVPASAYLFNELNSDDAIGANGYITKYYMTPMADDERKKVMEAAGEMQPMKAP